MSKNYGFKLIHFSTDYVFDGTASKPYKENEYLKPIGVYGQTKADGEAVMRSAGIDGWIIRTSWLFSPYGKNFVKTIFSLLQNKDEINVVADQTGSPTYALDLAAAILKVLNQNPIFNGVNIYHYTNSGHTTWYGLATAIQKQINTNCKIHPVDTAANPTKAKRPKYSVLSCEKIKKDFNLEPSIVGICSKRLPQKNRMNKRSILITGGAGFIGSHLVRHMVSQYPNTQFINLDALTYAGNKSKLKDISSKPNYHFVHGDITDKALAKKLFTQFNFDGVHSPCGRISCRSIH